MGGPATGEPIAIVGLSCRLPQAPDPASFWTLLASGTDAVTDVPAGRWRGAVDLGPRRGGFLADIEAFDASFFGFSPHEAAAMDPQQRLALELAWEALEQGAIRPADQRDTATGVFLAAISQEYGALADRLGADVASSHTYTGTHRSMIANRVSYTLGLRGPSLTVDSGQCSSLVAVHLACQSLRRGETTVALAGGVDLHLLADTTAVIGRFGALSPDGKCYPFDLRANGYVRGEGGAMVVLKPYAAAQHDGDRVLALVLGSAVNNDGGGASLTAPTARGQAEVIRRACADAGVQGADVSYVELHGTGTPVGDPIEAAGLGAALGTGRPADAPLLVGSVKTNVGHLEGAAGITGLLKVVLGLAHEQLPASLNFDTVNPAIDLVGLGLQVADRSRAWPGPSVAGVSSFGMGGTNCHVVLASAPSLPAGPVRDVREQVATETATTGTDEQLPWLVSARTAEALPLQATRLLSVTPDPVGDPTAVALALAHGRTRFEHRAVVLGPDRHDGLAALAAGRLHPGVVTGRARPGPVVLTFPGQGSQWPQMARALSAGSPVFARRLGECAAALDPFVDFALLDVLAGQAGSKDFDRVDVVQPALWAVMVSLAAVWAEHGVTPDVVIGHSQGEIAAATVAGALSLTDGARVVALRSRALRAIAGSGGMLSVGAPLAVVEAAVAAHEPHLTLAAVNGPAVAILSGPTVLLAELERDFEQAGHRARMIPVDYASHSAAVEPLREELLAQLAPVRPRDSGPLFVSTLTGAPLATSGLDADYWFRSARQPVRFATAVGQALGLGPSVVIECSPHPVAVAAIEQVAEQAEVTVAVLGTLRRDDGGLDRFRYALAQAEVAGAPVSWSTRPAPPRRELLELPTYAYSRRRHWLAGADTAGRGTRPGTEPVAAAAATGTGPAAPVPADRKALRELVRSATAQVLGYTAASDVDPTLTFKDLGVDSTTAVDLRNRLKAATGLPLPTGLLFDHPTVDRVTSQLLALGTPATTPSGPERTPETSTSERTAPERTAPERTAPERTGTVGSAGAEPIAIVAMGCRLPGGVRTPEDLWRLVNGGEDAITAFPDNRGWDLARLATEGADRSGTSDTAHGGFLHDADRFDAGFFGISPREALAMDPQQRLLLEVCWETVERAGIDPAALAGSDTGVFIGAMATDYGPRLHQPTGAGDGHLLTGTALSVTSGRIAYQLGLQGPTLTVDTACSSSLVALYLAVAALRSGECAMALAGGATVMATPGMFVEFSRQGGLASDGRCKAFSEGADGTAWAEGVGVLLLMRSRDARVLGHPVLAEIRGVAVNQDGRSNGLTAPNGPAQERVIRRALADAGLTPAEVDVVEAHGTGTRLGDPLEAEALLATYGREHGPERPLWLGSLKSNLGHTQAAAGVAGVLKMTLALQHRRLPRTLHAEQPTSHVDWSGGAVRLLAEPVDLPADGPVRAAVSSFGISGTNAHVVLESAPPVPPVPPAPEQPGGPLVWVLSARTATALAAAAVGLCDYATTAPGDHLTATGRALAARTPFEHRAVVVAADREELLAALAALAHGRPHPAAVSGHAGEVRPVFVFPGQGTQWAGMAVDLLDHFPVFAEHLTRCDVALQPLTGWSLLAVLRGAEEAPALAGSDVIQPALFAVMVSLAATWRALGVEPDAVVGHSQGEIAAACAAGAVTVEDAARIVLRRSRALRSLTGHGGMLALTVSAERAVALIEPWADRLWVAIVNGPASTVVAGDLAALDAVAVAGEDQGIRSRRVAIDYAAHTPYVEPVRADLLRELAGAATHDTPIAVCSSATGGYVEPAELTAEFWYTGLRRPVRFDQAVETCAAGSTPLFIEVSPHPALTGHVQDTLRAAGSDGAAVGSLRRGEDGPRRLLRSLGEAFTLGATVDWVAALGAGTTPPPGLPTYPFEGRRYWLEPAATDPVPAIGTGHPALTAVLPTAADDGLLATATVSAGTLPWIGDHVIGGTALLPGTALLELVLAAAATTGYDRVEDLTLELPLTVADGESREVQIVVGGPRPDGRRPVALYADRTGEPGWDRHASGVLATSGRSAIEPPATDRAVTDHAVTDRSGPDPDGWPPAGATRVDIQGLYAELLDRGYDYGPAFQGVRAAHRGQDGDLWVEVALPAGVDAGRHLMHPALLDAALHLIVGKAPDVARELLLPFCWRGVRVHAPGAGLLRARLRVQGTNRVAITAYDADGAPVVTVDELILRAVPRPADLSTPVLQLLDWVELPPGGGQVPEPAAAGGRRWTVLDAGGDGAAIVDALEASGARVTVGYDLPSLGELTDGTIDDVVLVPVGPELPTDVGSALGAELRDALYAVLDLVQGWLAEPRFATSRLVFVTTGAQLCTTPAGLVGAAVWGLVRSAETEHPGRFGLLDLAAPQIAWGAVGAALATGERELLADGTTVRTPRLRAQVIGPDDANLDGPDAANLDGPDAANLDGPDDANGAAPRPDLTTGTVLVTGGTTGLGALVARRLVERHGVRHLVLASRRGPAAAAVGQLVAALAELGATAEAVSCDVSDPAAVRRLIAGLPAGRPLTAVVHAAGVVADVTVERMSTSALDAVLEAKVDAGWVLHQATRDLPLAAFVLFSSVAGLVGTAGQANYAAANAFLDGLAAHRQAEGRPGTAIAWGLWDVDTAVSGGLDATGLARLARTGIAPLAVADALDLFDAAWRSAAPRLAAVRWDTTGLRSRAEDGTLAPALRALAPAVRRSAGSASGESTAAAGPATTVGLVERLAALSEEDGRQLLDEVIRAHVAAVLSQPSPDVVDSGRAFHEMGFDSLTAVDLRNRLDRETGLVLAATVAFDHPNVAALTAHLYAALAPVPSTPLAPPAPSALAELRDEDLFALIDQQS